MKEEALHKSIVQYLRAVLPHGWIVQHTANKPRSKVAGGIEKAMGAVAGWPDIAIYGEEPGGTPYPTVFFLEVKTPAVRNATGKLTERGGELTEAQIDVHDRLKDVGFPVAVVRSLDDVRDTIREWGLPSRDASARTPAEVAA